MNYSDIPSRPRSSFGFAAYESKAFLAGGHYGEYHHYEIGHFSRLAHCLDLGTGEWTDLPPLPVATQGFRMCGYQGGIFAFGGFVHFGDGEWPVRSTEIVRRLDIQRGVWEEVGSLSAPRSSNVLGLVGSDAYLIGGWNGAAKPNPDESIPWSSKPGTFHDTIEVFDLQTCKTKEILPLNCPPLRAFTAVTNGTDITVAGGLGPRGFSDLKTAVATFSTTTRKWDRLFDLQQGRFSPGIAWPAASPLIVAGLFVSPDQTIFKEFNTISKFDPHAP